ncbi:MAG TPA: DUF4412 domain-containing protein [Verrucomicrobiae bacterium]|nr:DUF4412 domain-containing protein [Verrucomicrobiae bacterium]
MSQRLQAFAGFLAGGVLFVSPGSAAPASFEGHISALTSQGDSPGALLYTVGTNFMRVEVTGTNAADAVDILDRQSGELTLLFPGNRCFVRFKAGMGKANGAPPGSDMPGGPSTGGASAPDPPIPPPRPPPGMGPANFPGMPPPRSNMPMMPGELPPGIGPQAQSAPPPGFPAMPNMPHPAGMGSMPVMPMMPPGGGLELKATGETTNLLGYTCERYEIKQWGQTMEIWATDQLPPFQVYLRNQPPGIGPPRIEWRWGELIAARGLFPLLASLKADNGMERYRFEVQSITPGKLTKADAKGFQTPADYIEIPARPF